MPDEAFDSMHKIVSAFIADFEPTLRANGFDECHLAFYRAGAFAHLSHQLQLAKAAALADGVPN